jgi:divalent metal cation (Fe/Co/Zn/Cd) transporter
MTDDARVALVRRGLWLNYATLSYNIVEAGVSLLVGLLAGSVALVGFGFDSVIEVVASVAAQWRLRADLASEQRERVEQTSHRVVGWCFLALGAYIAYESVESLWTRSRPDRTLIGIAVLAASAVVMPLLARAKRRVAHALESRSLGSEAAQTSLCAYLSIIALAGLALNALFGWWWADPLAALAMVPIIVKEGLAGIRRRHPADCCS